MHVKRIVLLTTTSAALALPTSALADYSHIVQPGESLSSIAGSDGLSISALAAANGVLPQSELTVGQVVDIPPLDGYTATGSAATSTYPASSSTSATSTGGSYVVRRGDTLSSIAAREGTSVAHLAAINGLGPNGTLLAGRTLTLSGTDSGSSTTTYASDSSSSGSGSGSYVIQPGDTLSAIAARSGTSITQLAALNGLAPDGVLLAGAVLTLPGGSSSGTTAYASDDESTSSSGPATGAGNQQVAGATSAGPYPTVETVSGAQVGSEAASGDVNPSLAEAIGWQESGYNNDLVSPTGAVGVMQIEPATWSWINQELTPGAPLDPSSAYSNVQGGVMLLHNLVEETGSDSMAAAAYYQGLASVEQHGLYPSTQQYVNDVMSLQDHFGG